MSKSPDSEIVAEDFESESDEDDESDEFNEDDEELDSATETKRTKQKQTRKLCPERRRILKDMTNLKKSTTKTNGKRAGVESPWTEHDQIGNVFICVCNCVHRGGWFKKKCSKVSIHAGFTSIGVIL